MFPLQGLLVSMFMVCHAHNPTLAAHHGALQNKMTSTDVNIDSGAVRGRIVDLPSGREYYSFQGIPYAKPPIGDLRFRPPEAVEEWTGVLETVKPANVCLQSPMFEPISNLSSENNVSYTGDEDCLYLNVYSASLDKKLPVMYTMTSTDVTIDSGTVRGRTANLPSGREYYSFQGISYAKPPIGDLRFRPPEPVDKWTGVLETVKPANPCLQQSKFPLMPEHLVSENNGTYIYGDEDCLYLNVYSASLEKKLPVMVWIHGGYFAMGDGSPATYGPEILLEKNIVLVTINYRLDAFGFLNLDLDECSGNMGLKDQAFALKWVQNNIEEFGGDPNNVTLFGESAGAISISMHLVSPQSKGLFHKAIIMSGHNTGRWTYRSGTDTARTYAKLLGNNSEDPKELLDFFKSLPAKDLMGAYMKLKIHLKEKFCLYMMPTIEKEYIQNAFITKKPVDYIKQGEVLDVPIIAGITSNEGILFLPDLITDVDFIVDNIATIITAYDIDANIFETEVKKVYDFSKKLNALTEVYMDHLFFYPLIEMVQLLSGVNKSPIYVYCHDFTSERDVIRRLFLQATGLSEDDLEGACHGDDRFYFFQSHSHGHLLTEGTTQAKVVDTYRKLLTNFANTGNPNGDNIGINWPKYERDSNNFLVIQEELKVDPNLFEKRLNLWKSLTQNKS